jgi:hypothetical protein
MRRIAAVAVAVLAGFVLFLLLKHHLKASPAPQEPMPSSAVSPSGPTVSPNTAGGPAPIPAGSASEVKAEPPPVIDSITVEKPSVCSGEENLITVKAHTTNGSDDQLHYVIDGQLGSSVPVTLWRTDRGVGNHTLSVFGRNNVVTTVPLPKFEVRECVPPHIVNIEKRIRSNTWADYDFVARVATPRTWNQGRSEPPKPFEPTLYVWSFGDGQSAATSLPVAEHNYEGRPQDSLYSYFAVSVEIHGKTGEILRGRTSLALMNQAFEALKLKGTVALMVSLEPRFPELGSDGKVTQGVHLWHGRPQALHIDHVARVKYYEQGAGEAPPEVVDVRAVLGTESIPPGEGIRAKVMLDPSIEPEVFSVMYLLSGTSAEGFPVSGSFSVMRPPPNPTRNNSVAVVDPELKAKIVAARQMLGKEFVSDEDIWQLERAGKFVDLKVQAAGSAAATPKARASAASAPPPRPGMATTRDFEMGPPVPTSVDSSEGEPAGGGVKGNKP